MPGYYAGSDDDDEGLLIPPGSKPYEDSSDDSASEDSATILESSERRRYEPLSLKIVCTPAQHRSGRGLFDQMKTLWASWVVGIVDEGSAAEERGFEDGAFRVFFGG